MLPSACSLYTGFYLLYIEREFYVVFEQKSVSLIRTRGRCLSVSPVSESLYHTFTLEKSASGRSAAASHLPGPCQVGHWLFTAQSCSVCIFGPTWMRKERRQSLGTMLEAAASPCFLHALALRRLKPAPCAALGCYGNSGGDIGRKHGEEDSVACRLFTRPSLVRPDSEEEALTCTTAYATG